MKKVSILGVIPARYASTRFPAKALVDINGKAMVQRVYEQALKSTLLTSVVVATDHPEIENKVRSFDGNVCITSESTPSGTDRCYEALTKLNESYDYVINIQGDEPFINPEQIDSLAELLDGNTEVATLARKIDDPEDIFDPNVVKAIFNQAGNALYFSRSSIPHLRGVDKNEWLNSGTFYKHIGIYGYRADVLSKFSSLKASTLEKAESLEQLRWLDNGFSIKIAETPHQSIGVDTPEDLEKLKIFY
ncbi:MAG: 3-deoxy-manno-octulosonate cytidylyltransferase [Bacteroidota bacterium]